MPSTAIKPEVDIDLFDQIDIRVGRVLAARHLEGARKPAYALEIDFGPLGHRQSSAQLTALYKAEDLVGRQVLAVVNFPPRRVGGYKSEVLTLGVADDAGGIILLAVEREAPLGAQVF